MALLLSLYSPQLDATFAPSFDVSNFLLKFIEIRAQKVFLNFFGLILGQKNGSAIDFGSKTEIWYFWGAGLWLAATRLRILALLTGGGPTQRLFIKWRENSKNISRFHVQYNFAKENYFLTIKWLIKSVLKCLTSTITQNRTSRSRIFFESNLLVSWLVSTRKRSAKFWLKQFLQNAFYKNQSFTKSRRN